MTEEELKTFGVGDKVKIIDNVAGGYTTDYPHAIGKTITISNVDWLEEGSIGTDDMVSVAGTRGRTSWFARELGFACFLCAGTKKIQDTKCPRCKDG